MCFVSVFVIFLKILSFHSIRELNLSVSLLSFASLAYIIKLCLYFYLAVCILQTLHHETVLLFVVFLNVISMLSFGLIIPCLYHVCFIV